jgi:hypothetical protein
MIYLAKDTLLMLPCWLVAFKANQNVTQQENTAFYIPNVKKNPQYVSQGSTHQKL